MSYPQDKDLLEAMIKARDEKINMLEKIRSKQEISLIESKQELHQMRIQQREQAYWNRLNSEKQKILLSSAEKRVHEIEQEIVTNSNRSNVSHLQLPPDIDQAYVSKLHTNLTKSMRIIGALDKQISIVKSSCDEVIRSLKIEISEMMDERSKIELGLLNQLAQLDSTKRVMEEELRIDLQSRQNEIENLQQSIKLCKCLEKCESHQNNILQEGFQNSENNQQAGEESESKNCQSTVQQFSSNDCEDNANQISSLKQEMDEIKSQHQIELQETRELILKLETCKNAHEQTISNLQSEVISLQNQNAFDSAEVLQKLTDDKEDATSTLNRVSEIQDSIEISISKLESQLDMLRGNKYMEHDYEKSEEHLVSCFDNVLLVNEQIKISLHLIECKLKNQLTAIMDGKVVHEFAKRVLMKKKNSTIEKTKQLHNNAILMIRNIEEDTQKKIKALQEEKMEQIGNLTRDLKLCRATIHELQTKTEITNPYYQLAPLKEKKFGEHLNESDSFVSCAIICQLQNEVSAVVCRMNQKNQTITQLTSYIEKQKKQEAILQGKLVGLNQKC